MLGLADDSCCRSDGLRNLESSSVWDEQPGQRMKCESVRVNSIQFKLHTKYLQ